MILQVGVPLFAAILLMVLGLGAVIYHEINKDD